MSNNLTGLTVSSTYGRLVQVVSGLYYDGFGNPLIIGEMGPTGPAGSTPSLYAVLSESNSASFSQITNLGTGSSGHDAINLNQLNNATASFFTQLNLISATLSNYATINYVDTGTASIWNYLSTFNPISATPSLFTVLNENNSASFSTITNLGTGSGTYDAVNLNQLNIATASIYDYLATSTHSLYEILSYNNDANFNKIINLGTGSNPHDAINLNQLNNSTASIYIQLNLISVTLSNYATNNYVDSGTTSIWNYLSTFNLTSATPSLFTVLNENNSASFSTITNLGTGSNGFDAINLNQLNNATASIYSLINNIPQSSQLFRVSSGALSLIASNTATSSGTASGYFSIAMGESVQATGANSIAIGYGGIASGTLAAIFGGQGIQATHIYSGAFAGAFNQSSGNASVINGGSYNILSSPNGFMGGVDNSSTNTEANIVMLGLSTKTGTQSFTTYMQNMYLFGTASMGNNRVINIANGIDSTDAINLGQLNTATSSIYTSLSNYAAISYVDTGTSSIWNYLSTFNPTGITPSLFTLLNENNSASFSQITNLGTGSNGYDAVNLNQLNLVTASLSNYLPLTGGTVSGEIQFQNRVYHDVYTASVATSTYSIDCSLSNYQVLTFTNNCQLSYTNPKIGHYNIICVATGVIALGLTTSGGWYAPAGIQLGFDNDVILMQMIYDGSRMIVSTYENLNEIV